VTWLDANDEGQHHGFAYLNTHERLGVILELIEVPALRREPEETR
jgi:hypothetical protein